MGKITCFLICVQQQTGIDFAVKCGEAMIEYSRSKNPMYFVYKSNKSYDAI